MPDALAELEALYNDSQTCAKLVGLSYVHNSDAGYTRRKHGRGFRYLNSRSQVLADKELKQRIIDLVIPPAWQEVWICPKPNGHILATGVDEHGRKQYIYHPKWRTMRDLIKFYRMIIFAKALPKIRTDVNTNLRKRTLSQQKVLAVMLWLLDNTYIRIGNEAYYEENESVGLTTLTDKNVVIADNVVTLAFTGKSGKKQQFTFDNAAIARVLQELRAFPGPRLFKYADGNDFITIEADTINAYLRGLTGVGVTAKDFRTWGGTLLAFNHLIEMEQLPADKTPKPEKVIVQAVDAASAILGNTRSVARASYIHPHILSAYGSRNFTRYYKEAQKLRTVRGLDTRETELLHFLVQLFQEEFDLLQKQ